MTQTTIPNVAELDQSACLVFGAARASGRVPTIADHIAVVDSCARRGLAVLQLLPEIKAGLQGKASKASREKVLKHIAELDGQPHEPLPEDAA